MQGICQELNLPLVVHFHGYDAYRDDVMTSHGAKYPQLFEQATAVVVVSKAMESQLLSLGAPASMVHRIPYGIDTDFFHPPAKQVRKPIFLAVGRMVAKKAPLHTLQAFGAFHMVIAQLAKIAK